MKGLIILQIGGKRKSISLDWKLLTAGSCGQIEKFTNTSKPFQSIQFPAHFHLLHHPNEGYMLVDTGYSDHFYHATKKFPYSLYAKMTPIHFERKLSAKEQLARWGIHESDVKYIFLTHFHADHISGILDFPNATFICSRKAYHAIRNKKGIKALLNGFLPALLPKDFSKRVLFLEEGKVGDPDKMYQEAKTLQLFCSPIYDVLGDGSLYSVDLSGHAHGQMGLLFRYGEQLVFLIADAAWDSSAFRNLEMPSKITKLIIHDYDVFQANLERIHHYHRKHPDCLIVPSHCREYKGEII